MKKKLLIGTIVVLGIAALIFMITSVAFALIVVWVYLVWMVRKKKANLFHDQVEPKTAERRLKMLKAFLLVAGISFAVAIVGVILHNVLYALSEIEEHVWFLVAIVALYVFITATSGGLVIFLKGRRKTT
ncbi:hypothetical protein ES703_91076 [subsurface metagenome]